jgi:anthranilate phosphoribosyltransferase
MENILKKLIERKDLTEREMNLAFDLALEEKNPMQVAAFLALMQAKGISPDELYFALHYLEGKGTFLKPSFPVLDIVGTGGDHANTFNISTGSAFVIASCGVKVAKHGSRSVSSNCGSLDVLEELKIHLDLSDEGYLTCLEEIDLTFIPATRFHSTWKVLKEIRTALKIRTFLNLLGPLLNPTRAHYQIVGVYKEELLDLISKALFKQGKKAMVVCSHGIDELTPLGPSLVKVVSEDGIKTKKIDPEWLGIKKCSLREIQGKDASYNAKKLVEVFQGKEGPWADTLALNAGCALFLRERVATLEEGVHLAQEQLRNGLVYEKLRASQLLTQKLRGENEHTR